MSSSFFYKGCIAAIIAWATCGCMSGPWMDVKAVTPGNGQIVVTVQTGTHVMNWIEGEKVKDSHSYTVEYRIENNGSLTPTSFSEVYHEQDISLRQKPIPTPTTIRTMGYSATDCSDDLYLCTKSDDGPWAVLTSDGKMIAQAHSIGVESFRYPRLVNHSWNAAESRVAFWQSISPDRLEPFQVRVWNYGQGQSNLISYVIDLLKAFDLLHNGKAYVPRSALPKN